ncbi:hypothetical protein [uncultured Amnibacterium sp.]|uniref:hypothetical protein n=1 Tax=uncultured Amnibacterium sp. TaxID=1631851 RepID=UPI0035CA8BAD
MRSVRTTVAAGAAAAALILLAGCTSNPVAAGTRQSAAPTSVAPATPTTPPPTQDAADAAPVSIRCRVLAPDAVVQALEPELQVVRGWTPAPGSASARLEALHGTTCEWTTAAGDTLEVAVAKPGREDSVALKNDLVERSQSVPTYGGEAYFQVVDHVGQADVFRGRTWLFVRSNRFFEPGDATAIVSAALDALGLRSSATDAPAEGGAGAATPAPTETPAG